MSDFNKAYDDYVSLQMSLHRKYRGYRQQRKTSIPSRTPTTTTTVIHMPEPLSSSFVSTSTSKSKTRTQQIHKQTNNNNNNDNNKDIIDRNIIAKELLNRNIHLSSTQFTGPNGWIFVGKHTPTQRNIAIKVFLRTELEKMSALIIKRSLPYERLCTEDRLVRVYEMFLSGQILYILHDYHRYGNLAQLLFSNNPNKKSLDEYYARPLFKTILKALNHMHQNKVAHRNLKLENILIDDNHQPILSDYTYTILVGDINNFDTIMATSLPYLAPEIIAHIPYNPIVADIWSFGVCLYIVLTNYLPYTPYVKADDKHRCLQFKNSNKLSEDVKKFLIKTLEYDVNKRMSTTSLLENSWFKIRK
ncbi:uncharacterized protein LOC113796921 [Dermatophagoides pteronyssinus]|uniref:uncharacterized protein LOC113796921 n=1 Tax=Dermatophagoides pteronyssinus TaxID=6956 RepID=UPI003F6661C9